MREFFASRFDNQLAWVMAIICLFLFSTCSRVQNKKTADRRNSGSSPVTAVSGEDGGRVSKDGFEASIPKGASSETLNIRIDPLEKSMLSPEGLAALSSAYHVSVTNVVGATVANLNKAVDVSLTVPLSSGSTPNKTDFYVVIYDPLTLAVKNILRSTEVAFSSGYAEVKVSLTGSLNAVYQVALALTSGQLPSALWRAEAKVSGLVVSNLTKSSAVLSWIPAASGINFTIYAIAIVKDAATKSPAVTDDQLCESSSTGYPKSSISVLFSNLVPATTYRAVICAKKIEDSHSSYSLATNVIFTTLSEATPTPTTTSDAPSPTNPIATVDSFDQITLSWTTGGGATSSYKIAYLSGATAPSTCSSGTTTTTSATSATITGLSASTAYAFRICALNVSGTEGSSGGATTSGTTSAAPSAVSSWSFVDGNSPVGINKVVTDTTNNPQLVSFNSKLYATWVEQTNLNGFWQLRVAVNSGNDISPSWTFIDLNGGFGLNRDPIHEVVWSQLIVFNSKLYLMWTEEEAGVKQIRIAVYNGSDTSPNWSSVDGNGAYGINNSATQQAQTPQMAVFNSKLYAIWDELDGAHQIRSAVYNGNDASPSWSFVDGNGTNGANKSAIKDAKDPHLKVFNSKLYAAWSEMSGSVEQIRVAVYNGSFLEFCGRQRHRWFEQKHRKSSLYPSPRGI